MQGACSKGPTAPALVADNSVHDVPPIFENVTAASGIHFTYRNGEEAGHFTILESFGGGIALLDFDGDGLLDVFIPGGGHFDGNKVLGHPCRLYRNLGNWKFEDVTEKVGLSISFPYSHGAAAFDYDNDGWTDLLVTGYGGVVLLHNEPDGMGGRRFVDVTKKAGLADTRWSSCAGWGDLDGDGFPEIYISRYGDWGFETNHPTNCGLRAGIRDICQPSKFKPLAHSLYHNNRNGTFTDVSALLPQAQSGHGLGVLFFDANGDGRPDIYVTNDTDNNFLYMNRGKNGELLLEEVGVRAGVAVNQRGRPDGSMGVDAGDFNRCGLPSLIVTNFEEEYPALYQNRSTKSQLKFNYATHETALAAVTTAHVSWGTAFFDYDHDGWEDLMITNGHVFQSPPNDNRRQRPILLHNEKGQFEIATNQGGGYFRDAHNARGAAFGDLDNDGKIDVVISHLNEPVVILRNVAPTQGRHWLGIELIGKQSRDVVGSRVVLEGEAGPQTRFAKGGGSYASTNDRRMIFGLGATQRVEKLTVYWSGGSPQEFANLTPDCYWRIVEGNDTAQKFEHVKR